jgi:hypothetical protein
VRLPAVSFVQTKLDFAEPESESRTPCEHVCPDQARPIRLHPIRPVLGTTKIYKYKKKFNKKKKKKKKKPVVRWQPGQQRPIAGLQYWAHAHNGVHAMNYQMHDEYESAASAPSRVSATPVHSTHSTCWFPTNWAAVWVVVAY